MTVPIDITPVDAKIDVKSGDISSKARMEVLWQEFIISSKLDTSKMQRAELDDVLLHREELFEKCYESVISKDSSPQKIDAAIEALPEWPAGTFDEVVLDAAIKALPWQKGDK